MIVSDHNSKPYVRWWWLNGPFLIRDIKDQLQWIKSQGFGGVEIAWLTPTWNSNIIYHERPNWLSSQLKQILIKTKDCAINLGLGCDFTFGSGWPFGGSFLSEENRAQTFSGVSSRRIISSWEYPQETFILNHLSKSALETYFEIMKKTFEPILLDNISSLFCDSLELDNDNIWSPELWNIFEQKYGYSLREHIIDSHIRYDIRKLLSKTFVDNFCRPFTEFSNRLNCTSRMQCHGAPADLITAYGAIDIPESESLLFPPTFSRIAASAATLNQKSIVSCETFTCLYGYIPPSETIGKEKVGDMKLLFDAVVSNGVNQIIWHGMPYNPLRRPINYFYTSINVGPSSAFNSELLSFNEYMERVCAIMRRGRNVHRLAVYLPNEDMMMLGALPDNLCSPGAHLYWEMRYVTIPEELRGFTPIWVSGETLNKITVKDNNLCCGNMLVPALYIDVKWLDFDALRELLRIANQGGTLIMKNIPQQPGHHPNNNYSELLAELCFKVHKDVNIDPLIKGDNLPPFWAREDGDSLYLFLAHPATAEVTYPMRYCQYLESQSEERNIEIWWQSKIIKVHCQFAPEESILLQVTSDKIIKL